MITFLLLLLASLLKDGEFVSLDQCGVSVNCLKYPSDCTSFESCNAVALYSYNTVTGRLEVQITSTGKWVAFGQVLNTAPNKMTNLYGAYCIKGNDQVPKFGLFKSSDIGSANYISASSVASVTLVESAVNGTYFTCLYSRPLDVGAYADSLLPLNDTLYDGALAYGSSLSNDGLLAYHDNKITSQSVVNWTLNPQPSIIIASSSLFSISSYPVFNTDILNAMSSSNSFMYNMTSVSGMTNVSFATSVSIAQTSNSVANTPLNATFSISPSIQVNSSVFVTNSAFVNNNSNSNANALPKSSGLNCKASLLVSFASFFIVLFI
ncbi:uncharacterized protein LOC101235710 isoform X2 [Hydra vulgaris]|uniref:Uncharacterized protein LOC101235710 isoform X2 n=1 Tax=Hydra vulgaris TaxID=6087 RepID=A0ABM4C7U3_HYDVU